MYLKEKLIQEQGLKVYHLSWCSWFSYCPRFPAVSLVIQRNNNPLMVAKDQNSLAKHLLNLTMIPLGPGCPLTPAGPGSPLAAMETQVTNSSNHPISYIFREIFFLLPVFQVVQSVLVHLVCRLYPERGRDRARVL